MKLTSVFEKVPEGYIAFVKELPGVNTQGSSFTEAKENLSEAIALIIAANRKLTLKDGSRAYARDDKGQQDDKG